MSKSQYRKNEKYEKARQHGTLKFNNPRVKDLNDSEVNEISNIELRKIMTRIKTKRTGINISVKEDTNS
jgi:hypothetical protein